MIDRKPWWKQRTLLTSIAGIIAAMGGVVTALAAFQADPRHRDVYLTVAALCGSVAGAIGSFGSNQAKESAVSLAQQGDATTRQEVRQEAIQVAQETARVVTPAVGPEQARRIVREAKDGE